MALADSLHGLLRLPGATYACVVERDTGRVLSEAGQGEGAGDGEGVVPYSVARWGTAVAAMFDATSGDELDDVMVTGRRSYHLVRSVGPGASVLAYLRLDRARANLAAARRELATVRWGSTPEPRAAPETRTAPEPGAAGRRRTTPPGAPRQDRTPAPPAGTRVPAALPPSGTPERGRRSVDGRVVATPVRRPERSGEPADAPRIPLPRRAAHASSDTHRRRGATRGTAAPPEGFATPAVLGQAWAQDPGTLRRLIAGLRRMT